MDIRTQGGKGRVGRLGDQDISDFPSLHPTRPHSHLVDDLLSLQPFFRCLQPQGSFLSDIQSSSQLSDTKYHCAIVWSNQAITIERLIQDSPEVYLLTMTTQGTLLLSWVRRTLRERRKDSPPLRKMLLQGCGLNLGAESPRFLCPWDSPGKNTGLGSHSLLQGVFLTQWSNPGVLKCRQILSHQGSPKLLGI